MRVSKLCGSMLLLAAACYAGEWSKNFAVSGRPELRVETNDAAVSVRAGDVKDIQARVITEGWKIGPDEVRVTDRQSGDRVEIDVRIPERWNIGNRSVRIEVLVPRQITSEIHTGDGHVTVEGLQGQTRLNTGDGGIDANSLDGSLEARTGDGKITARGRFDLLDVRTGDGSIEVEVQQGSKMSAGWRVHTSDGSVRLRLPEGFAADLDVQTGDGHISTDLPVTINRQSESALRGKMNGGGLPLTIRTSDGSIRIERL